MKKFVVNMSFYLSIVNEVQGFKLIVWLMIVKVKMKIPNLRI